VQVHRIPENRLILGYLFPSWDAGLAAMQEISTSDAHPSVTRVSDGARPASPSPPQEVRRHIDQLLVSKG
jgi:alkyldihydroxyacetonephosphate synthase